MKSGCDGFLVGLQLLHHLRTMYVEKTLQDIIMFTEKKKFSIRNSPQIHMFLPVVNGVFNDIVINGSLVLNSSEWKGFRFCGSYQLTTRIPEKEIEK